MEAKVQKKDSVFWVKWLSPMCVRILFLEKYKYIFSIQGNRERVEKFILIFRELFTIPWNVNFLQNLTFLG